MKEMKVIVRGEASGVFFGTLVEKSGREVTLADCRRLWYWEGAASLSQMAVEGVKKPRGCNFTMVVPEIMILDAIEILPCTPEAVANISAVPVWKV